MSKRRVVITGMGIVSPVGNDLNSAWDSVRNGRSGIGPIEVRRPKVRDRGDGAGPTVVGLAVGVGDVHRRQRSHDRDAGTVEIDRGAGHFEVLDGQPRRQRRPGDR